MESNLRELADLLIRWVHLIAGIMWIGNSMLFNWLDRNLILPENPKEGLEGEIWMVHSGGFYQVEKKQLAPSQLPPTLHWFKWQNGVTWISGVLLLVVVYYLGGGGFLVDPSVSSIGVGAAVAVGLGSIVGTWIFYDLLWKSPLGKKTLLAAIINVAVLGALAYGLCHLMSGRAAYIHIGVIMGTLMTGNVWLRIMPSQHELIAATKAGRRQDPAIAYRAKQRSIHNNYMTFPLLFIMVSNHFPSTYGNKLNWVILGVILVAGALVRHFMNIRFVNPNWAPPLTWTVMIAVPTLAMLMFYRSPTTKSASSTAPVAFSSVKAVLDSRCLTCHSKEPTDDVWKVAPSGVMMDTPAQIKALVAKIRERAVMSKTMPLSNKTGMTETERELIGRWIDQGAKLD